jgi:hypothetical protein
MKSIVVAVFLASGFLASATGAQGGGSGPAAHAATAYLAVDYADTERGILARLAVRSCARAEAPTANFEIRETLVTSPEDIVVRMVGADGREISRTVGSAALCQYGRFAAGYFARVDGQSKQ